MKAVETCSYHCDLRVSTRDEKSSPYAAKHRPNTHTNPDPRIRKSARSGGTANSLAKNWLHGWSGGFRRLLIASGPVVRNHRLLDADLDQRPVCS